MPQWKTISQRNFLKGLQATYGLFSQPAAILVRLSNLLYDRRGSLRTTDGSFGFTRNAVVQPSYGPITDITLYLPPSVNAYYVGIQRSGTPQQGLPSGLTGVAITVGGTIATAVRHLGIVTLTTTAAHNLAALAPDNGLPFNPGFLSVVGTGGDFDGSIAYNQISIVNATTISYPQAGIEGATTSSGALQTQLGPGPVNYTVTVTACDGNGGETPGQAAGPITVTLTAPHNAILFTWTAGQYNSLFSLYQTIGITAGRINPGLGALQTISSTSFVFFDPSIRSSAAPPAANTTQTCAIYRMDAPTYSQQLAAVPPYIVPLIGGIPGATGQAGASAGAGPNAVGGVPGGVSPLPQMAQFTGRLVMALGNGYPLQQYTDPSIDATGFQTVSNAFSSQYPDWQGSVVWNQGDQIKDSISGGVFQAVQTGTSAAGRPVFVNSLNATTADNTIQWKCIATKITPTPLRGAAHAIVYAGSLWIANTWPTTTTDLLDGPNVLKMSDVNNLSSWNPLNIAFIAKDDGDQIMGLATFTIAESGISPTGSLVLFKTFSTYQITGVFGASDFAIQQAQTDLGCVAPRSIAFVPGFGIMRMTHLGFAYFNGVADKLVSEEIRPYLFGGASDIQPVDWNFMYFAKAAQSANPPMYVCAVPVLANVLAGVTLAPQFVGPSVLYGRVSQLKLQNGVWVETSISAQQTISGLNQSVLATTPAAQANVQYRVYLSLTPGGNSVYAQAASFSNTLLNYTTMTVGSPSIGNGQLQRLICYDLVQRTWTILDLPFQISTLKQVRAPGTIPLTIAGGYSDSVVRRLFAGDIAWDSGGAVMWSFRGAEVFQEGGSGKVFYRRVMLRGQQTASTSIQVSIALSGKTQAAVTAQQNNLGTNQWRFTIDIMQDALNANATVSGTGPISIDSLDWQVKPKPVGAPVSIQK
jgi:hypothetical protein